MGDPAGAVVVHLAEELVPGGVLRVVLEQLRVELLGDLARARVRVRDRV